MVADIKMDTSLMNLMGAVEVGYYHNNQMIDFEIITDVKSKEDLELLYRVANIKWFGIIAANILERRAA